MSLVFGSLARRGFSGDIVLRAGGKDHRIGWHEGAVVAAESAHPADSAVKVAITLGMITSTQAGDISQALAASPSRDELEVVGQVAGLTDDVLGRLSRRVVGARAARILAPREGEFVVSDELPIGPRIVPIDARWILYTGIRSHFTLDRLEEEMARLATVVRLRSQYDLTGFGFSAAEEEVLHRLQQGDLTVEPLPSGLDPQIVRAVILSLIATGECEIVRGAAQRPPARAAEPAAPQTTQRVATGPAGTYSTGRLPSAQASPTPRSMTPQAVPVTPGVSQQFAAVSPGTHGTSQRMAVPSHATTGPIPVATAQGTGTQLPPAPTARAAGTNPAPPAPAPAPAPPSSSGPTTTSVASRLPLPPMVSRAPTPSHPPPMISRTATPLRDPIPAMLSRTSTPGSMPGTLPGTNPGTLPGRTGQVPIDRRQGTPMRGVPVTTPPTSGSGTTIPPPVGAAGRTGPLPTRRTPGAEDASAIRALINERLALLESDADHYSLLGIDRTADPNGIRAAYFELARLLHPDRLAALGILDEDRTAQRLFARINDAFTVLSTTARRTEYDALLDAGGVKAVAEREAAAAAVAQAAVEAEERYRLGEMAMRRQQADIAVHEFQRAVELKPDEPDYMALLGWALYVAARDKVAAVTVARAHLQKALSMKKETALPFLYLGRIARMEGEDDEAARAFRRALEIAPGNSEAQAELRVVEARRRSKPSTRGGLFSRLGKKP